MTNCVSGRESFRFFDGASRSDAGSSRAIRANGYQIYIKRRIVGVW